MPYRDKSKQRGAVRSAVARHRGKGITSGITLERAAKLLLICRALDCKVIGLGGRQVSLLDEVRYGVLGSTMSEVKSILE